jgi:hypothetical protein
MTERAPTLLDMPMEDTPSAGDDAPIAPARPRDKVRAAVAALAAAGKLKSWHTDVEVRKLGNKWLEDEGCLKVPGGSTWRRETPRLRHLWRSEQNRTHMNETVYK